MIQEIYRCVVIILVGVLFGCCIPLTWTIGVLLSEKWDKRR